MSNLKDEIKSIEIPASLRSNVQQTIFLAGEKKQSRLQKWLPYIASTIVTVAAALFIIVLATDVAPFQQSESSTTNERLTSKNEKLLLVGIVGTLFIFISAVITKRWVKWSAFVHAIASFSILSWLWTGIYTATYYFEEPVVLPISVEVLKGYDADFWLRYILEEDEPNIEIVALQIGDVLYDTYDLSPNMLAQDSIYNYHYVEVINKKRIYETQFTIDDASVEQVVEAVQQNAPVFAIFSNENKVPLQINKFDFFKHQDGQIVDRNTLSFAKSGGGDGTVSSYNFAVTKQNTITSIELPDMNSFQFSYALYDGPNLIASYNALTNELIDNFPYTIETGRNLTVQYEGHANGGSDVLQSTALFIIGETTSYYNPVNLKGEIDYLKLQRFMKEGNAHGQ
jgi:hypothetical protein